jgi:tellurite resistance protein TerC
MLEVTAIGWAATLGPLAALLGLDLLRAGRRPHAVGFREAALWSLFYIAVAVLFGVVFGIVAGWDLGAQYFAGYIVEKSLSVDNLFVFLIIMSTFAVPAEHQARALTIGIVAALALRAIFIAGGAALLDAFSVMFLIFGLALIATAAQLFRHRNEDPSVEDNVLVSAARRMLPFSGGYHGARIVTRAADGRRALTPLFLVLVAIGTTDLLFALDSIPAVFGVTQHAYIVFVANAFALLGLRSLFFLVSGLLDRLVHLSAGLGAVLAFIGAKLILHFLHLHQPAVPEISTGVSLAVIVVLLACATTASVLKARRDPALRAHSGALRESRRRAEGSRAPGAVTEPSHGGARTAHRAGTTDA